MEAAKFVAIFVGVLVAMFSAMIAAFDLSGERSRAAKDRRMAEHRLNARLLKLNI